MLVFLFTAVTLCLDDYPLKLSKACITKAFFFGRLSRPAPTLSGRQLTISNPPPASDAGLERQECAATAMTSLFQSCGGF